MTGIPQNLSPHSFSLRRWSLRWLLRFCAHAAQAGPTLSTKQKLIPAAYTHAILSLVFHLATQLADEREVVKSASNGFSFERWW